MDRLEWQINKSFRQNEEIIKLKENNEKIKIHLKNLMEIENEYEILDELGDYFYSYIDRNKDELEKLTE